MTKDKGFLDLQNFYIYSDFESTLVRNIRPMCYKQIFKAEKSDNGRALLD